MLFQENARIDVINNASHGGTCGIICRGSIEQKNWGIRIPNFEVSEMLQRKKVNFQDNTSLLS